MGQYQDESRPGNGHSIGSLPGGFKRKPAPAPGPRAEETAHPGTGVAADGVTFKTSDGLALRGSVSRIQRHAVAFELYSPPSLPRLSEALADFKIVLHNHEVYAGRAVVSDILDAGPRVVCKATLELLDWIDLDLLLVFREGQAQEEIRAFLNAWQKNYRILDGFKILIADMQTFFHDLQLLLDRTELRFHAQSPKFRQEAETKMASQLAGAILPLIGFFFERFEEIAEGIPSDDQSAHMDYMRQHLHPLVLSAPFANHTFCKPRGYAGDYEMVNMIERNDFEGKTLFAKILHKWFVQQPPAEAHRNRIQYLAERIEVEVERVTRVFKRSARILSFACGPAAEVRRFAGHSLLANEAEFTLEDFDDQALAHSQSVLHQFFHQRRVDTTAVFNRKSVYQLLKESQTPPSPPQKPFDLVYCAGLFDYVPQHTCQQMMDIFYGLVAPGGLLLATNVNSNNPLRYGMEHLLDWHLIYRNEAEFREVAPEKAHAEDVRVLADETGVNLFLEIRKSDHG